MIFHSRDEAIQPAADAAYRVDPETGEVLDSAANVENQRKVNRTIMAVMLECGIEEDAAKAFLIKVVQGKVPHLKITY